jgi:prepilin-type N-terminal cleavage/methylation domain-containing protein/prepilin-type processing-associated H-X9-DG protein
MPKSRKAFTLIELLVVIAIISLLVSILLPSLSDAKELARTAVCATNMRNLNMTSMMYVQEFDGFLPAIKTNDKPENDNRLEMKYRTGTTQLIAWANGRPADKPTNATDRPGWALCPSDRDPSHNKESGWWDSRQMSYSHLGPAFESGIPRKSNGKRDKDKAVVFHRIKPKSSNLQPQEVFMYAEAAMDRSFGVIWFKKGKFSNNSKSKYGLAVRWNYMFRHRRDQGMNLVFFDGHVDYMSYEGWDNPSPQWRYWQ